MLVKNCLNKNRNTTTLIKRNQQLKLLTKKTFIQAKYKEANCGIGII